MRLSGFLLSLTAVFRLWSCAGLFALMQTEEPVRVCGHGAVLTNRDFHIKHRHTAFSAQVPLSISLWTVGCTAEHDMPEQGMQ